MKEVLRLIRFSLLLRLVPAVFGLVAGAVRLDERTVALGIAFAVPSLLALFLVVVTERRHARNNPDGEPLNPREVKRLLGWAVFAYALETVVPILIFRLAILNGVLPPPVQNDLNQGGDISLRRLISTPLFFVLIPTVLGAWIDGRRGWFRWAGLAILVNFIGIGLVFSIDLFNTSNNVFRRQADVGDFVTQSLVVAVVCYFVASLADQQRQEHAQLESANIALGEQAHVREQLAGSRERMNISRDLHDTVAHTLAALSVQMNAIGAVIAGEQPAARRELTIARELVKEGLENTRRAISGLRSAEVENFGLSGALQKQVDAVAQRTSIEAHFEQIGGEPTLSDEVANTLFRIAQEALNNVERHAQAQHAWVKLTCAEKAQATLSIRDDGIGFDVAELDDDRFGLRGMRERAELIGAHIRLDSVMGQGTTITVKL